MWISIIEAKSAATGIKHEYDVVREEWKEGRGGR